MEPSTTDLIQCQTRFFELCGLFDYSRAIRVMGREYSAPDKQDIWRKVQCETSTKAPAVSKHSSTAHKADVAAVKATGRYAALHTNTHKGA